MFSRSSGYAIQALPFLAGQPSGKTVGAREIATTLQIPMPLLWKIILRRLGERNLVRSFKVVQGGYELARAATEISTHRIPEPQKCDFPVAGALLESLLRQLDRRVGVRLRKINAGALVLGHVPVVDDSSARPTGLRRRNNGGAVSERHYTTRVTQARTVPSDALEEEVGRPPRVVLAL
jgi:hypothetical protein